MPEAPPIIIAVTKKGEPKLIDIHVRESTTAPGRLKIGMTIPGQGGLYAKGPDGKVEKLDNVPEGELPEKNLIFPEFRIETN